MKGTVVGKVIGMILSMFVALGEKLMVYAWRAENFGALLFRIEIWMAVRD